MSEKRPAIFRCNWEQWALLVGLVVGVPLLLWAFLPEVSRKRENPRLTSCKRNLHQIALACHSYAEDNDGWFPTNVEQLYPDYVRKRNIFRCPSADARAAEGSSYVLEPGLHQAMPGHVILAYGKAGNHGGKVRSVAFAAGFVEWRRRGGGFEKELARQREAVEKWRAAGAKVEDTDKFFKEPSASRSERKE